MDISVSDLKNRLSEPGGLKIVDVREPVEFYTYNIGGTNITLSSIDSIEDHDFSKQDEIIVVCQRGIRSKTACKILKRMGYSNVRNLTGGLMALRKLNDH
jgi:rhodanese-related sulfurtransferase